MDISRLKKFITLSNEDFADAHEPVNDGIKEVPTADDIAREVGRSSEGDVSTAGPAKVIPEQPDVEEESDTPASTTAPAETTTGSAEPAGQTEQIKPSESGDDASPDDEPTLAHDNLKQVDADEDVTASDKTSLENFLPKVRRSELIGYSKRDTENLTKSIARLRRRAGVTGGFSVSNESINEAIGYADAHLVKLAKKRKFLEHKVSIESLDEVVSPLNEAPLVHPGAAPLPVAQGLAITEAELGPVIDTVVEEQALADTYAKIEVLERAGVAIENLTDLLRENKGRVSKQTAAIIHVALEHIDNTCGLRVRTTGLENYDASPKAAMESADVDEKSLGKRAADIGAKIIKFLKSLWEKAKEMLSKFNAGAVILKNKLDELDERLGSMKGQPSNERFTLEQTRKEMFIGTEFVGYGVTRVESDCVVDMLKAANYLTTYGYGPMHAALNHGDDLDDALDRVSDKLRAFGKAEFELPGNWMYQREGMLVRFTEEGDGVFPQRVEVDVLSVPEMKRNVKELKAYLDRLQDDNVSGAFDKGAKMLMGSFGSKHLSDSKKEGFDEQAFQKAQNRIVSEVIKPFDYVKYANICNKLASMIGIRVAVLNLICDQYGKNEKE